MRLSAPALRLFGCVIGLLCLGGPAAAADWLRAESQNFTIYTDMDARAAERLSGRLEAFDQVLRLVHSVDADEPVRRKLPIYLLRRASDLRKIHPGAERSVRGFYTSTLDDTYAVAVAGEDESALLHEYVHHFMLDRHPFGYAGWLVEGYAEYFMTFRTVRDEFEVGSANANRAAWLVHERWIPFETLLTRHPGELRSAEERALYYAQAWALTHWFLSERSRGRQLNAYVAAVGRGEPSVKAMTAATGLSPEALGRTVKTYLEKGFPVRRLPTSVVKARPLTTTRLSPAAADVLLPTLRVKNDNGVDAPEDDADGPALMAAVRAAAERHRGDRLADLALARAELKLGDPARVEGLLQAWTGPASTDYEALQLMAAARLRAARNAPAADAARLHREAVAFASRAHKLNPDYYPTLVVYAQAREGTPRYPTENDLNVLLDALDLAPQVGLLRLKAAAALARRGREADAVNVLQPVAFNPHGGEAAQAARALLGLLNRSTAATETPEGGPGQKPGDGPQRPAGAP